MRRKRSEKVKAIFQHFKDHGLYPWHVDWYKDCISVKFYRHGEMYLEADILKKVAETAPFSCIVKQRVGYQPHLHIPNYFPEYYKEGKPKRVRFRRMTEEELIEGLIKENLIPQEDQPKEKKEEIPLKDLL